MEQGKTQGSDLGIALAKMNRVRKKGATFTRKERDFDEESRNMEMQKMFLNTKRKMHKGQYNAWLDSVYQSTIIPYCKAWNRAFATKLQTCLPHEVRGRIHDNLWYFDPCRSAANFVARSHVRPDRDPMDASWTFDTLKQYPMLLQMVRSLVTPDKGTVRLLCDQAALPHYLNPDYVGGITAVEIVQSLYKAFNACGLLICRSNNIANVLAKDQFYIGLSPINMLRNVTVHCKIDRMRTSRPNHELSFTCCHSSSELAFVDRVAIKQEFKPLLDIKKKGGFKLQIVLFQRNIRINVLAEVIEALSEVYQSFRQNGACVTVSWTYRGHWKDEKMPEDDEVVFKDITTCFEMPRVVWEYNMCRFLEKEPGPHLLINSRHWKLPFELSGNRAASMTVNARVHSMWSGTENDLTTDGEDESDENESDKDEDDDDGTRDENEEEDDLKVEFNLDFGIYSASDK